MQKYKKTIEGKVVLLVYPLNKPITGPGYSQSNHFGLPMRDEDLTNKFKVVSGNSGNVEFSFATYDEADMNAQFYAKTWGSALMVCPRGTFSIVKQSVGLRAIGKRTDIDYKNPELKGVFP